MLSFYAASHVLKPEGPRRTFLQGSRLSRNGLGVAFSLAASSAIAMIVAGSTTGLNAVFLDLLSIFSIALSPVCVKGSGYRIAIGIGVIATLSASAILVSRPVNTISIEGLGAFAWALIQIAIVQFAYRAYRENRLYPRF
jgi:hypothetical protein